MAERTPKARKPDSSAGSESASNGRHDSNGSTSNGAPGDRYDHQRAKAVTRLVHKKHISANSRALLEKDPEWLGLTEFVEQSEGLTPAQRRQSIKNTYLATRSRQHPDKAKAIADALNEAWAELDGGEPDDEPTEPSAPDPDDLSTLSDDALGIVPLASVKSRAIKWHWPYRLSNGVLAMMAGDGGLGKSQLLLYIAAATTRGSEWPDGSGPAPIGNVIIVSAEDRPDDTIKPRLLALGADLSRITIVKAKKTIRRANKPPEVHPMSFQDHEYWKEIFKRIPGCVLFIVDPLPSYLGRGVNDSKNTEIRSILEPFLEDVIAPLDICMLGNTHLNKSVDAKTPMHRISGSIAYGNLPRNVHFVVRDPENPARRFFKQGKCNNAPDTLSALAFTIEERTVEDNGELIVTAMPVFEAELVDVNLHDMVSGGKGSGRRGPDPTKSTKLAEWLYDYLTAEPFGPKQLAKIIDAAGEAGFIGTKKPDGKWSAVSSLYAAKDRVPQLIGNRANGCVSETALTPAGGSRPLKHWHLTSTEGGF